VWIIKADKCVVSQFYFNSFVRCPLLTLCCTFHFGYFGLWTFNSLHWLEILTSTICISMYTVGSMILCIRYKPKINQTKFNSFIHIIRLNAAYLNNVSNNAAATKHNVCKQILFLKLYRTRCTNPLLYASIPDSWTCYFPGK